MLHSSLTHSQEEQTIIAQCTPRGSGAIALLRISGINAINIAANISKLASGKPLSQMQSHTIHYGSIITCDGTEIDKVMFTILRAPKTFTGQDTVEITCHNNQFIIDAIISGTIEAGARLAQEGEFTKRAVLNGKIDLVQAEAINELIHAQTQLALKKSLSQLSGSFSYWIDSIEKKLIKALALSEASFEFLDEEMEFSSNIQTIITEIRTTIISIKKTFNQQQQIRQGVRIAIIGSVNAGKSSLFNALLNQERAIVASMAGTTRDSIEAGLYKNGNFWTLVDTAGLRQTDDIIEQEGIRRSFEEAQKADIIVLVYDSSRSMSNQEESVYTQIKNQYSKKIIIVYTKSDETTLESFSNHGILPTRILRQAQDEREETFLSARGEPVEPFEHRFRKASLTQCPRGEISVSAKTKDNIDALEQIIQQKIDTLFNVIESPFLLNQRQHNLLLSLEITLVHIEEMLSNPSVAYEILSIHLNDAVACLAQLSGKAISEAGMDAVFREFCVGK